MSYDLEEMLKKVVVSTADPGEPKVNIDLDKPLNQSESLSLLGVCVCARDRSVRLRETIYKRAAGKDWIHDEARVMQANVNAS